MTEAYVCLFCHKKLEGDKEWADHLRSYEHGAAQMSHYDAWPNPLAYPGVRRSEPFLDIPEPDAE